MSVQLSREEFIERVNRLYVAALNEGVRTSFNEPRDNKYHREVRRWVRALYALVYDEPMTAAELDAACDI